MRIAVFDSHRYDRDAFETENRAFGHELTFFEPRLTLQTAPLAAGFPAVCSFVNDRVDEDTLTLLAGSGVRFIALRSAGYNHVNLEAAARLGLKVARVPEYSPHAVAEHAMALIMALNRKIYRAHARVREWNFALDGLVGFDLHGKTAAVVGTGRIGAVLCRILRGFGCHVLAFDLKEDPSLVAEGVQYTSLAAIYAAADVISLHVPLTPATHHLVNADALAQMKPGVMLINTGRGALIDAKALIDALKVGQIGAAGLDVYEEEEGIFFRDLSDQMLKDDVLARLLTFPNVLITSHQAFLTREALANIAATTLENARAFEQGEPLKNEIHATVVAPATEAQRAQRAK